jgi:hypothetical protein
MNNAQEQAQAQAVAAAEEAQRSVESSKLPLFYADPAKDQFTADQWMERFEMSRRAGQWNAAKTASYFYNSLRSFALKWYRGMEVTGVDTQDWDQVKTHFNRNYSTHNTSKLIITDFNDLKQGKTESVQRFFSRVADILYNYKDKMPINDLMGPLPDTPEEFEEADAGWDALPIAVQRRVQQRICRQNTALNIRYMGVQFFAAGLHADLQLEVIRTGTIDMNEAFDVAHKYETAIQNKQKAATADINEDPDEHERAEIEALRRNFQQRRMFNANNGSAYQPRTTNGESGSYSNNGNNGNNYSNGNGGGSNSTLSGAQPKRNNPAFGKTCHYCKKKNHFQADCHKRKRENGEMVKDIEDKDPALKSIFKTSKN